MKKILQLLGGCIRFKLSIKQFIKLLMLGVRDIYWVFPDFKEWAEWYATLWSWRTHEYETAYPSSTQKDWIEWVNKDKRFALLDGSIVVEHDWQS